MLAGLLLSGGGHSALALPTGLNRMVPLSASRQQLTLLIVKIRGLRATVGG